MKFEDDTKLGKKSQPLDYRNNIQKGPDHAGLTR